MDRVEVAAYFEAEPQTIYDAWLSSEGHTAMTGSKATTKPEIGAKFTAWDGYISGVNVTLKKARLIVQTWRTTDFSEQDDDSRIEVMLTKEKAGTKVQIVHTNIPKGQGRQYRKGWREFYFDPMKEYFR